MRCTRWRCGQLQPACRVEPAHQDRLAGLGLVHTDAGDQQAIGVRQRQRQQRAGQAGPGRRLVRGPPAPPQVGVGQRDALGPAGGAAGVQQRREVAAGPVHDRPRLGRRHLGEVEHRNAGAASPRPEPPATTTNRTLRRSGQRGGDLGQELGRGHHADRAGVGQRVPQLVLADQEDQRGHHRPGPPGRGVGDQDLGAVGHQHDQPVPGPDAKAGQPGREPGRPVGERAGRVPPALEEQRVAVALPLQRQFGLPGQVLLSHVRLSPG